MVYGFVKQSGGHVRVVSASAAGTSLTLFLPRADTSGAVTSPVAPVAVIKAASRPPVVTVRL
jgi:hypothetical protein